MNPKELGERYDAIAAWWDAQHESMSAGIDYLNRAIAFTKKRRTALDVGCGNGRLTALIAEAGFEVLGIDVSRDMLRNARQRNPNAKFIHADICDWQPPDRYDLIVAWDSTFHVPHSAQRDVITKLCNALAPGGVLLFTAGGTDGEITGEMNGQRSTTAHWLTASISAHSMPTAAPASCSNTTSLQRTT
jgi:SAM-dependent methyltransferase